MLIAHAKVLGNLKKNTVLIIDFIVFMLKNKNLIKSQRFVYINLLVLNEIVFVVVLYHLFDAPQLSDLKHFNLI